MKNIETELEFENRIKDILSNEVKSQLNNFILLDFKKATDIMLCRNGDNPQIYFIEIKYYNTGHGRLGFGHANGKGFQPEILRKNPSFFQKQMRWILGSIEKESYYILDNATISQYISGGQIDFKQNNFQTRLFNEIPGLNKAELIDELLKWLKQ